MKRHERGFTLIELIVQMAIVAFIASAAAVSIFQILNVTTDSSNHITAIRQVENAGYWISQDALVSEHIVADNDTGTPEFLIMNWTIWGQDNPSVYHIVTYSFQNLSGGIGKLMRNHWSSAGASENTSIAEYIYYNPSDTDNTTSANYTTPVLDLKIASRLGEASYAKEYKVWRRPEF